MLLLCIASCGKQSKEDSFAGVYFQNSQSELESRGFICKDNIKNGGNEPECTNFDAISIFGRKIKSVRVIFNSKGKINGIVASNIDFNGGLASLISDIEQVYPRIHRKKDNDAYFLLPGGASFRVNVFEGVPGYMAADISLTAINAELEKKWTKDDQKE